MDNRYALPLTVALVIGLTACSETAVKKEADAGAKSAVAATSANSRYYEVHQEGRLYVFDDDKTYLEFLATGETPFTKRDIGKGPHGETVVFGLTKGEKEKLSGIPSVEMYYNQAAGSSTDFYGEIIADERFYVFQNWNEMQDFRKLHEANLAYKDIGGGPGGKTVVYVLNNKNKENRPEALIQRFKAFHHQ